MERDPSTSSGVGLSTAEGRGFSRATNAATYNSARMRYALALCIAVSATVVAQQPADQRLALTTEDYARAERFLTYNTTPLVFRSGVRPTWLRSEEHTSELQ